MTLEQRIEELEKKVANLTMPNGKAEELVKMMRDTATEAFKNARRPGGIMHNRGGKAAKLEAAGSIHFSDQLIEIKGEDSSTSLRLSRI